MTVLGLRPNPPSPGGGEGSVAPCLANRVDTYAYTEYEYDSAGDLKKATEYDDYGMMTSEYEYQVIEFESR